MIFEPHAATIEQGLVKIASDSAVRKEVPGISKLMHEITVSRKQKDPFVLETALVKLYSCLHIAGSRYSTVERKRLESQHGYTSYPGGFSPLIRAEAHIRPESTVTDLGAGNGLQGLLMQHLYPHRKTVQVELSADMIRVGRIFQKALGIDENRVEWVHDDIVNVSIRKSDFVYIYRPARPIKEGKELYRIIADKLIDGDERRVVFSIADCISEFLAGHFSIFFSDGHLTCFKKNKGA